MTYLNIYLVIFITLVAALIASYCQILYKKGLTKRVTGIMSALSAFHDKRMIIGLGGYVLSLVIYLYALSNAPLSVVYPVFASTFIFVALFSSVMLKEKHLMWRYVGVLFVFVGICIIAASSL